MTGAKSIRTELWEKAVEVATLLNSVDDDDEREILQRFYEETLNAELAVGARIRRGFARLIGDIRRVGTPPPERRSQS